MQKRVLVAIGSIFTALGLLVVPVYPEGRWVFVGGEYVLPEDANIDVPPLYRPAVKTPLGPVRTDLGWGRSWRAHWPGTHLPGADWPNRGRTDVVAPEMQVMPGPNAEGDELDADIVVDEPPQILWRTYWVLSLPGLAAQIAILWAVLCLGWFGARWRRRKDASKSSIA